MLATIREMRQNLAPKSLFDVIAQHSPISQKDLFRRLSHISERTLRRRLDDLLDQKKIVSEKHGRNVVYSIYPH